MVHDVCISKDEKKHFGINCFLSCPHLSSRGKLCNFCQFVPVWTPNYITRERIVRHNDSVLIAQTSLSNW